VHEVPYRPYTRITTAILHSVRGGQSATNKEFARQHITVWTSEVEDHIRAGALRISSSGWVLHRAWTSM